MAEMDDDELLDALGVEVAPLKAASRTPREERIIAGFEDILRFHQTHGRAPRQGGECDMRISAIVDGCFSLIVDGETASPGWRWGSAQALGLNVAQSSTISLKRAAVGPASGPVLGSD